MYPCLVLRISRIGSGSFKVVVEVKMSEVIKGGTEYLFTLQTLLGTVLGYSVADMMLIVCRVSSPTHTTQNSIQTNEKYNCLTFGQIWLQ